jgi:hypothetical protein
MTMGHSPYIIITIIIIYIGRMAIDVPEQAMKIKEKRLFDIIDYQQEVILKLEDSETPMRGPHFKAMLVRVCHLMYDVWNIVR